MQQWRTSCSLQTGQLKHDACFTLPTPRSPSPMMAALKVRVARVYGRRRRYSEIMDRTLVGPSWDAALQPYVGQKVGGIPTSRNAARAEFADSCDLHRSATRAESPFAPRPKRGLFLSLSLSLLCSSPSPSTCHSRQINPTCAKKLSCLNDRPAACDGGCPQRRRHPLRLLCNDVLSRYDARGVLPLFCNSDRLHGHRHTELSLSLSLFPEIAQQGGNVPHCVAARRY